MNRRTTWLLVGLAALLAIYVWYSGRPGTNATGTATPFAPTSIPGSGALFKVTADQITGIWVVDMAANRSVAVSKDAQGNWRVIQPDVRPADSSRMSSLTSQFSNIFVNTVITTTTDLAPFGVLSPTYRLGVNLVDGSNLRVSIGDKNPIGSGYYALRDGESNVVVVNTSAIDGLTALLETPPYAPTPTPTGSPVATALATTTPATATPSPPSPDPYKTDSGTPAPGRPASATP